MSKLDEMIDGFGSLMAAQNIVLEMPTIYNKVYIETLYYKQYSCTFRHVEKNVMIRRIFAGKKLIHKTRFNPNIDSKLLTKQKAYSFLLNAGKIKGKIGVEKTENTQLQPKLHDEKTEIEILKFTEKYEKLMNEYHKVQYSDILRAVIYNKIRAVLDKAYKKFGVEIL